MFGWPRREPAAPTEEKRRVLDALSEYPRYAPPVWSSDTQSLKDAGAEYREYFFDSRSRRIDALCRFLVKFDVALSLNDAGVKAVSAWCPLYGELLVEGLDHDESEAIWYAYHWFQAPWTGSLIGLNPIFDLGIYMGECILSRNPGLKWQPVLGVEPNTGASHPIFGQRCARPFDPIKWIYSEFGGICAAKRVNAKGIPHPGATFFINGTSLYSNIHAQVVA